MIHKLKTVNPFFNDVALGIKTFEVRKNDRNFQVGDILWLKEYIPESESFTGKGVMVTISYVLDDENYCKKGFVILGFKNRELKE